MTDIIKALERIAEKLKRAGARVPVEAKGTIESAMATGLSMALVLVEEEQAALSTYRASVDAVELPEPEFYYRPVCGGEMYEGPHHARSVGGRMMREEKPGEWFGLHHESTVRRLIAEAVAREREAFPNLSPVIAWLENGCDPKEAAKELRIYMTAIRARGGE